MTLEEQQDIATAATIGDALLRWIGAVHAMRHASPRGGLDYFDVEEGSADALIRDFVAWCTGHPSLVPGSKERMQALSAQLAAEQIRALPALAP